MIAIGPLRGLFLLLLALAAGCGAADVGNAVQPIATALVHVKVEGKQTVTFNVEVARTAAEQRRGLMFRQSLPPSGGMLFPFDPPQTATFWMKDTYIPLDMVFIRADGTIARIAANTTPLSLDPVGAGEAVAAVLEIAGGEAARAGIRPGDRVSLPSMRH